jgi:SAM-dependent methyltransferase
MAETSEPFRNDNEDSYRFDAFIRSSFFRSNPVIADQILAATGITRGTCLEIGSGPASLAMAIALLSELRVTALDRSAEMHLLAQKNVRDLCLEHLVHPVLGDVHAIPAGDASFDLAISRASYHAWKDPPAAFREILRVLKPSGMAYIGGGYGSARIRSEVLAGRCGGAVAENRGHPQKTWIRRFNPREIEASFAAAGINEYRFVSDDSGFWMIFRKRDIPKNRCDADPVETFRSCVQPDFHDGFFFPRDRENPRQ